MVKPLTRTRRANLFDSYSEKKEEAKQSGEMEEKVVRRSVVVELPDVFKGPSEEVRYTQNPLIASHPSSDVEML